jgi:lysophospholipid acyltransferase (LPLAT)-like uncharacterized protein
LVYGYALGLVIYAYCLVVRATTRVVVERETGLADANYIFCLWHEAIALLFHTQVPRLRAGLERRPHAWLQHPTWFMKPSHVLLHLIGVEQLVLGSTGHGGRAAADELVVLLRRGYSTVFLPDGPHGPPRVLKKGVLHVALESAVPIVPLRLTASAGARLPTWDRKWLPLPFSRLELHVGTPIKVQEATLTHAEQQLLQALG